MIIKTPIQLDHTTQVDLFRKDNLDPIESQTRPGGRRNRSNWISIQERPSKTPIQLDHPGNQIACTGDPNQRKEMKTKVKCLGSGLVHFVAVCSECDWGYEDYHTPATGHKEAKAHVKATGHRVTVEEGFATIYDKETTDNS